MAGRGTDIILGGNPEIMARAEVDGHESGGEPRHACDETRPSTRRRSSSFKAAVRRREEEGRWPPAACTSSAPSATSRAASTTSCAAAPAARATPASSPLLPVARRRPDAHLRRRPHQRPDGAPGHARGRAHRARLVNRAIENAQRKVEGRNFDIRKNLLEYDDVMNQQRKTVYALRRQILEGRYVPELTEEDKKARQGAAAAADAVGRRGRSTRWARRSGPRVAQIVDAFWAARRRPRREAPARPIAPTRADERDRARQAARPARR